VIRRFFIETASPGVPRRRYDGTGKWSIWRTAPESWELPAGRAFAELLIDCEEDRTLRAVLGMLREHDAGR
jgi:hypothetical protein